GFGFSATISARGSFLCLSAFLAFVLVCVLYRNAVTVDGGFRTDPKSWRYSSAIRAASESNSRNRDSIACFALSRRSSPCSFHFWYSEITSLIVRLIVSHSVTTIGDSEYSQTELRLSFGSPVGLVL